jgi:hypothetical protein
VNQERIERLLGIKVKTVQSLVRLVTGKLSQPGLEVKGRQYQTGNRSNFYCFLQLYNNRLPGSPAYSWPFIWQGIYTGMHIP